MPQKEVTLRRMLSTNNLSKRKDAGTGDKEGFAISSTSQDKHYNRMREETGIVKGFDYQELLDSGKCPMRPMFTVWDVASK